ncbi:MAG TPA: carboxymuconolactone decarboxylase family protein [Xanthobacteraceae bacterium]|jgi:4-carboxymuconolactone decarboxylase
MLAQTGRRKRGLEVYRKMGWGTNPDLRDLDEDLWALTTDFVFGEVWSRPGLSLREREIAVLAVLIAFGTEGMDIHLRNAPKLGITYDQIRELIFQVMYYVGQPRGLFAMKRLKAVMTEGTARRRRRGGRRSG